jgi:glutaredoxin
VVPKIIAYSLFFFFQGQSARIRKPHLESNRMVEFTRVSGANRGHKIMAFTLSTCGWCRKTKRLLDGLEVEYEYCDIDSLTGADKEEARAELKKFNPSGSMPTLVIDGDNVIVGFKEEEIREALA